MIEFNNIIPESISKIYYLLKDKGWIFQLILFLISILLFIFWKTPDNLQFLTFLSCSSLLFVAIAPQFKLKLEGTVHYVSAIIWGITTILWILLMGYWEILFIYFVLGLIITIFYPKQYMLWLECSIAFSIIQIISQL